MTVQFLLAILASFIAGILVNLIFFKKRIQEWNQLRSARKTLEHFWGKSSEENSEVHIYYPAYPYPRVGRAQRGFSRFVSEEDTSAAEQISTTLKKLGFNCFRHTDMPPHNHLKNLPISATVVLLCGPKMDTDIGRVVADRWTGGNAISSKFYFKHGKSIGLNFLVESTGRGKKRKIYLVHNGPTTTTVRSPSDDNSQQSADSGILIRVNINKQRFVLCWGIHGYGTLGCAKAITDPECLETIRLDEENMICVTTSSFREDIRDIETLIVNESFPITVKDVPEEIVPDPQTPGKYVAESMAQLGLSCLWATEKNVSAVKDGRYADLNPVAAELDLSLKCQCACKHCAYSHIQSQAICSDPELAKRLVEKLAELGVHLLLLTGGREPLISNCVEDTVISARKKGMFVTLYTNGLALDRHRSFNLMDSGLSELRISLDDISSDHDYLIAHALQSGTNGYGRGLVLDNIAAAIDIRGRNSFRTRIGVSIVLSNDTLAHLVNSIDELAKWLRNIGPADYIVLRPAVNYFPKQNENQFFTRDLSKDSTLKRAVRKALDCGVARHVYLSEQRFMAVQQAKFTNSYDRCLASLLWLNVGPTGDAYLCCERKHVDDFKLGNILSDDWSVIANSLPALQTREGNGHLSTIRCPTNLCKPTVMNICFNKIEKARNVMTGSLLEDIEAWLVSMRDVNKRGLDFSQIPSVSGVYTEELVEGD